MTDVLKHRFVSPKLDGPDTQQVQPTHWNDGHRLIGGSHGNLLTRDVNDAAFGATWTPPETLFGARIDVPYAVSWYGPEAGVWTVEAVDQLAYSYSIVGKLVTVGIFLYNTELSGAGTSAFRIYYSFGTAAKDIGAPFVYAGPVFGTGYVTAPVGTNYLRVMRDFPGTPWPMGTGYTFMINLSFWLQ